MNGVKNEYPSTEQYCKLYNFTNKLRLDFFFLFSFLSLGRYTCKRIITPIKNGYTIVLVYKSAPK